MSDTITKKDLQEMFTEHQSVIIDAVDGQIKGFRDEVGNEFKGVRGEMSQFRAEMNARMDEFDAKLKSLTDTLDAFLQRMTVQEDEFKILKAEVAQMKAILKEKLGVEVAL